MKRNFFSEIKGFSNFLDLTDDKHYVRAPDDWIVVITDVQGSTQAIAEGRYKTVNMVGASTVAAIINAIGTRQIPFVFGGDGATALIPSEYAQEAAVALSRSRELAWTEQGLRLRIGLVPHRDLLAQNAEVQVAKFLLSSKSPIAFFRGTALAMAEKWIKSGQYILPEQTIPPDFDPHQGLSCRWAPLPHARGMILSVLVKFTDAARGERIGEILKRIHQIVDLNSPDANPIKYEGLKIDRSPAAFALEFSMRQNGESLLGRVFRPIFRAAFIGTDLFLDPVFRAYKKSISPKSDYRKFDEMLRMVIDCSPKMRDELEALLRSQQQQGLLFYGLHESSTALMTCFVEDLKENHIHFVDGSNGGYALAAKAMKAQMGRQDLTSEADSGRMGLSACSTP